MIYRNGVCVCVCVDDDFVLYNMLSCFPYVKMRY